MALRVPRILSERLAQAAPLPLQPLNRALVAIAYR
jgi:hypothetical protein